MLITLCPGEYIVRGPTGTSSGAQLIQEENLVFRGTFRLPQYPNRYDATARGLCYYPAHDSLFVVGKSDDHVVGEVVVPGSLDPAPSSIGSLPVATQLQAPNDPTDFQWLNLDNAGSAALFGGVLVHADKLIVSAYRWYDASPPFASLSHFVCNLDLTYSSGPFQVGDAQHAGYRGGYMCNIPAEWQAALGGYPCATGLIAENIVPRTSQGATLHGFNPADLGVTVPTPGQTLVYYPNEHPVGGLGYEITGRDGLVHLDYNQTFAIGGVVFPSGWRSVLFIGSIGVGPSAYGTGTSDLELVGTPTEPGGTNLYVYDPVNPAHGGHAYPYKTQIWAYDANDLAAVVNGRAPWSVTPYAQWELTPPFDSYWPTIAGAAWDQAGGRLFISQQHADGDTPLIHVYTLE